MAEKNIEIQERNAANTGWDTLLPATKASNVRMSGWAVSGENVETSIAKKADKAMVANKNALEPINSDPNTTKESLILTNHANSPSNEYWYINSSFYANEQSQVAQSYLGLPKLYIRSKYNDAWQPWAKLPSLVGDGRLDSMVRSYVNDSYGEGQVRDIILSPYNPEYGHKGSVWIKYK